MRENTWSDVITTSVRAKHARRRAYVRRHMPRNQDNDYEAMAEEMKKLGYYSAKSTLREISVSIKAHVIQIEEEDEAHVEFDLMRPEA